MAGYTGVSFPFRVGAKGGVVTSTTTESEVTHINESIRQILLTRKGERPMEPEFGTNLYRMIFEVIDETMMNVISFEIKEALARWEPRIRVMDVVVQEDDGVVRISLRYLVVRSVTSAVTSITIEKGAA